MKSLDNLFLSISEILGIRMTPDNFRSKINDIKSIRGFSDKDRTAIIVEILAYLVESQKNDTTSI